MHIRAHAEYYSSRERKREKNKYITLKILTCTLYIKLVYYNK